VSFDQLGLSPALVRAVADEGYTEPTPIQREAIPIVLAGRDLMAGAQTGTGKTAAFVLPLLQRLGAPAARDGRDAREPSRRPGHAPVRALILVPTRELALQVEASVRTYGRHQPVRSTVIHGGVSLSPQLRALRSGPAIVVATPGRLLDHVGRQSIDLSAVEVLVLDEADRMLDMGFIHDIRRIIGLLPEQRQNLLFSATFSEEIRALAGRSLIDPATIDLAPRNAAAELVEQQVLTVDRHRKRDLLVHLVSSGRISQALVFTRTKHGADHLARHLDRSDIRAVAIHGNKSQAQRNRALEMLKRGRVDILVATDVAARGLDIDALPFVVNFDVPVVASDYVHRIGRTGRAGLVGQAYSLVAADEAGLLADVERLLRRSLPREAVAGFEPELAVGSGTVHASRPHRRGPTRQAPFARGAKGSTPGRGAGRHDHPRPGPAAGRHPRRTGRDRTWVGAADAAHPTHRDTRRGTPVVMPGERLARSRTWGSGARGDLAEAPEFGSSPAPASGPHASDAQHNGRDRHLDHARPAGEASGMNRSRHHRGRDVPGTDRAHGAGRSRGRRR
jgi:ATP-dependent RNA helicase RhlE